MSVVIGQCPYACTALYNSNRWTKRQTSQSTVQDGDTSDIQHWLNGSEPGKQVQPSSGRRIRIIGLSEEVFE